MHPCTYAHSCKHTVHTHRYIGTHTTYTHTNHDSKRFFLRTPMHVNNMSRDSASYRSIAKGIISNIIWFIADLFIRAAPPFLPPMAIRTQFSLYWSLPGGSPTLPLLLLGWSPLLLRAQAVFWVMALELVTPNQSETQTWYRRHFVFPKPCARVYDTFPPLSCKV